VAALARIAKLSERIDALSARRVGRLDFDMLTPEAEARLDAREAALRDARFSCPPGPKVCDRMTDDEIMRRMLDLSMITADDFKPGYGPRRHIKAPG
jgi:hypothetical protein